MYEDERRATSLQFGTPTDDMGVSILPQSLYHFPAAFEPYTLRFDFGITGTTSEVMALDVSPQQVFGPTSMDVHELVPNPEFVDIGPSPPIKAEPSTSRPSTGRFSDSQIHDCIGNDVDSLMKTIQTNISESSCLLWPNQAEPHHLDSSRSTDSATASDNLPSAPSSPRRYACKIPSCSKVFNQKTHLEIHIRAHTGYKPYVMLSSPSTRYINGG